MNLNQKQLRKIFKLHSIGQTQWDAFNAAQQEFLAKATTAIDVAASAEFASLAAAQPASNDQPEPTIDSLGANTIGKRKSSTRTGSAIGAKPLVRKLLGELVPASTSEAGTPIDAHYPKMSMAEICEATKKSEVNIRTILSDLRSPKYCGAGGVFMTKAIKEGDTTFYQYVPAAE